MLWLRLALLSLVVSILAGCGGNPQFHAVAVYGYSQPTVTERITFKIVEGKEPVGKLLATTSSREEAEQELIKAVAEAVPEGDHGVQLFVPSELKVSTLLPACVVRKDGLLICGGVPTGSRFAIQADSGMVNFQGGIEEVVMIQVYDYKPALKNIPGYVFAHDREEAKTLTSMLIADRLRNNIKPYTLVLVLGLPPAELNVTGCAVQLDGNFPGLLVCTPQQPAQSV